MDKGGQGEKPRIVVDASVAVKWAIEGEPWETQARTLLESIVSRKIEAYAPTLFLYEVASVMLRSAARNVLKLVDGIKALKAMGNLGINVETTSWNDLAEILKIAATTNLTIYDSTYLHLSKKVKAKLVTVDKELKRKGEKVAETILLKDLAQTFG
ncbi:type II toxin-antitoxin system VapC family toxin [Candidatus Bathyarchaeota archaeon]|nr:type II toxin-antitoxin system VapC family toxin [Candidatus Bathyarchaeota archaeon]